MQLYRGFKEKPVIFDEAAAAVLEELSRAREAALAKTEATEPTLKGLMDEMGAERFARWWVLTNAKEGQFFTDDEAMARGAAGEKGYVISMDVEDGVAAVHYSGTEMMSKGRERGRMVTNFFFLEKK